MCCTESTESLYMIFRLNKVGVLFSSACECEDVHTEPLFYIPNSIFLKGNE